MIYDDNYKSVNNIYYIYYNVRFECTKVYM